MFKKVSALLIATSLLCATVAIDHSNARGGGKRGGGGKSHSSSHSSVSSSSGGVGESSKAKAYSSLPAGKAIIGDVNSKIYHVKSGASYQKVLLINAKFFSSEKEAQSAKTIIGTQTRVLFFCLDLSFY